VRIPKDTPTVDLLVGVRRSGEPVHEEVPVTPVGSRRFRLLASPTLVLGAAAGDEIEVDEQGVYSIVRRGDNVAVHVEATEKLDDSELVRQVNELGGVRDWSTDDQAAIEAAKPTRLEVNRENGFRGSDLSFLVQLLWLRDLHVIDLKIHDISGVNRFTDWRASLSAPTLARRLTSRTSPSFTSASSNGLAKKKVIIRTGTRHGVFIRVVIDKRTDEIITAYPINRPRNP
jgi:Domain of unknown function (DUF4265)